MRSPAPVLVDRQVHAVLLCQLHERLPLRQIQDERLLAQHVPLRPQRISDEIGAALRMCRDVDDLNARVFEQFAVIGTHAGVWEELLGALPRLLGIPIAERKHLKAQAPVCPEVALTDPAAAYEQFVENLLASPRYGERWATHWLDVARYADSDGYRADDFRPEAYL